ncbi:MAG: cysteine desulfurase [Clostridia bacterium]|nr:cysteine desulfurase [Clostridia bacterium]
MMKEIYLDNSATTALCEAAKDAISAAMECYGNPSSLHPVGQSARALVEQARKDIAATLGVRGTLAAGQLIFTSCGSEADNLAILGTAFAKERRRGGRIITTDSEHPGVESALRLLEKQGFEVIRISTRGGELNWEEYRNAINDRTFLVTMMMVNNETGAVYDLKRAFAMAKAKNRDIVTHCDAVQGYLKCRFTPALLGADLVAISAHKIHAPKGVGALYVSPEALKRRDIVPTLLGGGQESGFRSGTENLIGIAAFGAAARDGYANLNAHLSHLRDLRDYAQERVSRLPVKLHIPSGERAPHILNFALPDIKSETMLHELSKSGICISGGSACSAHSKNLSRALLAFGVPENEVECSVRVSFGRYNTREDVDQLVSALDNALQHLVRIHR